MSYESDSRDKSSNAKNARNCSNAKNSSKSKSQNKSMDKSENRTENKSEDREYEGKKREGAAMWRTLLYVTRTEERLHRLNIRESVIRKENVYGDNFSQGN